MEDGVSVFLFEQRRPDNLAGDRKRERARRRSILFFVLPDDDEADKHADTQRSRRKLVDPTTPTTQKPAPTSASAVS